MLFGKIIDKHVATEVITYQLISYENKVFSIAKRDIKHDTTKWIIRNIHNKQGVMLIWNDVIAGIQK